MSPRKHHLYSSPHTQEASFDAVECRGPGFEKQAEAQPFTGLTTFPYLQVGVIYNMYYLFLLNVKFPFCTSLTFFSLFSLSLILHRYNGHIVVTMLYPEGLFLRGMLN